MGVRVCCHATTTIIDHHRTWQGCGDSHHRPWRQAIRELAVSPSVSVRTAWANSFKVSVFLRWFFREPNQNPRILVSGLTTCRHSVEDSGLADELRRAGRRTMADQAQFEALIRALMSEKNEERTAAEAQFEALVASPAQAAPLMCTAMATSADMTVRSMTTVMFRKRVNEGFYKALAPETQAAVKAALIGCVQNENDAGTRKKMADTTGEVACMIMEDNPDLWPEMFPFLFTSAQSPEAGLREAAHIIMSRLAFSVSAKLAQDVPSISTLCGAGMQDPHKDVRLAALSATGSIVQALSSYEAQVSALTGLVPVICGRFCDSTYERSIDARTDPASVRRADADFERER